MVPGREAQLINLKLPNVITLHMDERWLWVWIKCLFFLFFSYCNSNHHKRVFFSV